MLSSFLLDAGVKTIQLSTPAPWHFVLLGDCPERHQEFPAAVETSRLFAVGRSGSWGQPLPSSGNQPQCCGLPTLLPFPQEGPVGFPAMEQERNGDPVYLPTELLTSI